MKLTVHYKGILDDRNIHPFIGGRENLEGIVSWGRGKGLSLH